MCLLPEKSNEKKTMTEKNKFTFYTWKRVMREPRSLNDEAVLEEADEVFHTREACVLDAKRKCPDEDEDNPPGAKRVIIKKSRTVPAFVDEVDCVTTLTHVERLLTLCYCLEVVKIVRRLSTEFCMGCLFHEEGEPVHTCREQEQADKYFNLAINDLNED